MVTALKKNEPAVTGDIDCVVIGVNAAKTLGRCLESIQRTRYSGGVVHIIYVDGGSSDASVSIARGYDGVSVLELNLASPTPGQGRNAGWQSGCAPFVQFVDSDMVVDPDWFDAAAAAMSAGADAVSGRLQEMHPEQSLYNWIGNLEWNAPAGESNVFGGCVMLRRDVLEKTGGYDGQMVVGEDPELSQRFRKAGGRIVQLEQMMAMHDLGITSWRQQWRRTFRTGYGFADVSWRHGRGSAGFWQHEFKRIVVRGGLAPLMALVGIGLSAWNPASLLLLVPAMFLLLYPRLCSVENLMTEKSLNRRDARRYAWHCSFVVIPEFLGMVRFGLGLLFKHPLRNRPVRLATRRTMTVLMLVSLLGLAGTSCRSVRPIESDMEPRQAGFTTETKKVVERFAPVEQIAAFSNKIPKDYLLGYGDVFDLVVWGRPELSRSGIMVAPDGKVSVVRIGIVNVLHRTVEDVTREIEDRLKVYYETPSVTMIMKAYANNKAYVLGRVSNPGMVTLSGEPTLLEAIAQAGGLPVIRAEAFLTKCAIIRGRNQVIWIDLRELLQGGNIGLNARLQNNDIVFIPESEDELVYVMGEVVTPGPHRLKSELTCLDVMMRSGGPTKDADLTKVYVIRSNEGKGKVIKLDYREMLETGNFQDNFMLQDNDVVYVSEKGLASFNYVIKQLTPALEFLNLGTGLLEDFGVMQEWRKSLFNQEGFVGD